MTVEHFKRKLSKYLNLELDVVVTENRCTMLNLLEKRRNLARLSMHKMFLEAPDHVISAIAHYIRGTRKDKHYQNLVIRGFIQQNLGRLDYSHLIDKKKLIQKGKLYDLQKIYDYLNREYFQNRLNLQITWYGYKRKTKSRIIFGQYYDALKLIKIHRRLDDPFFPEYFVTFVIYHEMLHSIVPGFIDRKGHFCTHGEDFKAQEKLFEEYEKAMEWEKKNRKHFFR